MMHMLVFSGMFYYSTAVGSIGQPIQEFDSWDDVAQNAPCDDFLRDNDGVWIQTRPLIINSLVVSETKIKNTAETVILDRRCYKRTD